MNRRKWGNSSTKTDNNVGEPGKTGDSSIKTTKIVDEPRPARAQWLLEQLAVGIGLAGEGEGVGAGGGGHAPEADGAGADVGVEDAADGRDSEGFWLRPSLASSGLRALRLVEMTRGGGLVEMTRGRCLIGRTGLGHKPLGKDLGGLLAGGDDGAAVRDALEEGGDVGGGYHLEEGVGGVVTETADLAGGVVEGEALIGTEGADGGLVEAFLGRDAEVVLIGIMDDAHYAPEVVDPVGVIEGHAPAVGLGRETAQEEDAGTLGEERLERVLLRPYFFHSSSLSTLIGRSFP